MSVAKTYPRTFIPELLLRKKVVYKPESLIFLLSIKDTYTTELRWHLPAQS